jgi:hypothetical protein
MFELPPGARSGHPAIGSSVLASCHLQIVVEGMSSLQILGHYLKRLPPPWHAACQVKDKATAAADFCSKMKHFSVRLRLKPKFGD